MIYSMTLGNGYEVKLNEITKEWEYFENEIPIPLEKDLLYKYLPFNENTISSLLGNYFYLANPFSFNDPFDCNKNLIVDYSEDFSKITWNNRNHFKDIGVISFSEEKCHPLMWAHYTNNYNGLVIEFEPDINKIFKKERIKNIRLRKVIYTDYPGPFQKAFPFSNEVMLISKLSCWRYEREWRIVADLNDEEDRFLNFHPKQVKKIYLGYNLVKNNSVAFGIICNIRDKNYPHAEIWWVRPSANRYGAYEVKKIEIDKVDKIYYK